MSGVKQKDVIICKSDNNASLAGKYFTFSSPPANIEDLSQSFCVYYKVKKEITEQVRFQCVSNINGSLSGKYITIADNSNKYLIWFRSVSDNPVYESAKYNAVGDVRRSLAGKYLTFSSATQKYALYFRVRSSGAYEVAEITCTDANNLNGKYFVFNTPKLGYYVWFSVDDAGQNPNIAGRIGVKVDLTSGDTSVDVANKIFAALQQAALEKTSLEVNNNVLRLTFEERRDVIDAQSGTSGFNIRISQGKPALGRAASIGVEILTLSNLHGSVAKFKFSSDNEDTYLCFRLEGSGYGINASGSVVYIDFDAASSVESVRNLTVDTLRQAGFSVEASQNSIGKFFIYDTEHREIPTPSVNGALLLDFSQGASDIIGNAPALGGYTLIEVVIDEDDTASDVVNKILSTSMPSDIVLESVQNDTTAFVVKSNAYVNLERATVGTSGFSLQLTDGVPDAYGLEPEASGYEKIACDVPYNADASVVASRLAALSIGDYQALAQQSTVIFTAREAYIVPEAPSTGTSGFSITTRQAGIKETLGEAPSVANHVLIAVEIIINSDANNVAQATYNALISQQTLASFELDGNRITITRENEGTASINIATSGFAFAILQRGVFPPKPAQNWKEIAIKTPLPPAMKGLQSGVKNIKNTLQPIVDLLTTLLEAAKIFYGGVSDPFKALVGGIISEVENVINNLFEEGVYVLVVSPLEVGSRSRFVLDSLEAEKSKIYNLKDRARLERLKGNKATAAALEMEYSKINAKIELYQKLSRDSDSSGFPLLTPSDVVKIITESLEDEGDTARPIISDSAQLSAIGFMLTASSKEQFAGLIDTFLNVVQIDDFERLKFDLQGFIKTEARQKQTKEKLASTPPDWRSFKLANIEYLAKVRDTLLDALETFQGYTITADESVVNLIKMFQGKLEVLSELVERLDSLINAINLASGIYVFSLPRATGKNALVQALQSEQIKNLQTQYTAAVVFLGVGKGAVTIQTLQKLLT